jgi:hypothetical protein
MISSPWNTFQKVSMFPVSSFQFPSQFIPLERAMPFTGLGWIGTWWWKQIQFLKHLQTLDSIQSNGHIYIYILSLPFQCYEEEDKFQSLFRVTTGNYYICMSVPVLITDYAAPYLRIEDFQEIVKQLLSNHDDRELNAQFRETSRRITHVYFEPCERRISGACIPRMNKKSALQWRIWSNSCTWHFHRKFYRGLLNMILIPNILSPVLCCVLNR